MRMYDIALFVFLFQISLSIVYNLNITNTTMPVGLNSGYLDGIPIDTWARTEAEGIAPLANSPTSTAVNTQDVFSYLNAFYQFAILAIPKMASFLFNATFGLLPMMTALGMPDIIALPLTTIVYIIYVVGFYQIFSKSSMKEYS